MDEINQKNHFFKVLSGSNEEGHLYRRGVIQSELQTPCCPLVSRMILPDPLTIDSISKIQKKPFLCISYGSVLPCIPMLQEYENKSKINPQLRKFVDYQGAITLFTLNNSFNVNSKIENGNFIFYVNSSKYELDLHTTKIIIDLLRPSMSIIPCELIRVNKLCKLGSRKRNRVIDQYSSYYKELKESSNVTSLINTAHRIVDYDKDDVLAGIDISGLGYGESLDERAEVIKEMIKKTPEDKLRIIQLETGTPLEILHSVLLGVDIVVSPYPEILSSEGKALCFNLPTENEADIDLESLLKLLNENCKYNDDVYTDITNSYIDLNDSVYYSELNKKLHEDSIRKESRSYVHHLLKCKEITAGIILSSHNLWMYEALFEKIRNSIEKRNLKGFIYNFIKSNVK